MLTYPQWNSKVPSYILHTLPCCVQVSLEIGFHDSPLESSTNNLKSAEENPDPVHQYLQAEDRDQRILGPFPTQTLRWVHISLFGVIPKRHKPGKWRLILDQSSPDRASVNTGIRKDLCSLQYTTFDEAATILAKLGPGSSLAKIEAFRNIPVHPADRPVLRMHWDGKVYLNTCLPFGLQSAPKIFRAVSNTWEWILWQRGVSICLYYIDDFFTHGCYL